MFCYPIETYMYTTLGMTFALYLFETIIFRLNDGQMN